MNNKFTIILENGYIPLPCAYKSKRPIVKDWSQLRPTADDCMGWDKQTNLNIGVLCGSASGIVALDIDTDDKEILNSLPQSSVVRRGKKGEVRFFRVDSSTVVKTEHLPLVDVIGDGGQVILPPSIHPEGMSYVWLTEDTLYNTTAKDLPLFDHNLVRTIINSKVPESLVVGGRNNQLKKIASAMFGRGCAAEEIAQELYKYDVLYHSKRLFNDASDGFKSTNEKQTLLNALKFTFSIGRSLIDNGMVNIITNDGQVIIDINDDKIKPDPEKISKYPEPRGIMKKFIDYCELKSSGNQDCIALGGAISLMSILASNKFATKVTRDRTTCPNTYILNIAPSGWGKETPQNTLNDLLSESNLLGSGSYKSGTSIMMNLPEQQERLDIIDECSSLLKVMSGKESYQSEVVDILSSLYSKAQSKFTGVTSVVNGKNFGACYNPHVSILGSTTPNGFQVSVNREMASKGLLPRFFLFRQHSLGAYKPAPENSDHIKLYEELTDFVKSFLELGKIIPDGFTKPVVDFGKKNAKGEVDNVSEGSPYVPRIVQFTNDALDYWVSIEKEYHEEKSMNADSFESAFYGRFAEQTAKLALLDSLSLGRDRIEVDSVAWGIELIKAQWENSKSLYEIANSENRTESTYLKVLQIIKRAGFISKKDLIKQTRTLLAKERNQVIESLVDSGDILVKHIGTAGRTKESYAYNKS